MFVKELFPFQTIKKKRSFALQIQPNTTLVTQFYPLRIQDIRRETSDCVSIAFAIPSEAAQQFQFIQGQYITLRHHINGEELRRSYSICSSPLDGELRVAIKAVSDGRFSTFANTQLQVGDVLDAMPPMGKFHTPIEPQKAKQYLGIAAGSGITPLMSILKTVLQSEPDSQFTLVYGNKNKTSIVFKDALEALKDKYLQRLRVIHVLSRERSDIPLFHGRIDQDKCQIMFKNLVQVSNIDAAFLCGPEEMILDATAVLADLGVDKKKVHFELFTAPGAKAKQQKAVEKTSVDDGRKSKVSVTLDGISFDFELGYQGENILDAAMGEGADLPYACKGGVCCTCKAMLREGEVEMDINYGLEPEEIAAGYILTCQAHPRTERVVVDFDTH